MSGKFTIKRDILPNFYLSNTIYAIRDRHIEIINVKKRNFYA